MAPIGSLDRIVLRATKSIRADAAAAWERWLADEATAHGGALWRLLDPAPPGRPGAGHSHVVHLPAESCAAFDRAETDARGDGRAAVHAEIRRDEWVRAGDALRLTDDEVSGLIAAEVLCADPSRADEWDTWYDEQHLPDMMASGAFIAGSRWRRAPSRAGTADHLTVYEIGGCTVEDAIERSAAVMPTLTAAGRKHECHTGGLTWALELVR